MVADRASAAPLIASRLIGHQLICAGVLLVFGGRWHSIVGFSPQVVALSLSLSLSLHVIQIPLSLRPVSMTDITRD